jgi:hypothetical protein
MKMKAPQPVQNQAFAAKGGVSASFSPGKKIYLEVTSWRLSLAVHLPLEQEPSAVENAAAPLLVFWEALLLLASASSFEDYG